MNAPRSLCNALLFGTSLSAVVSIGHADTSPNTLHGKWRFDETASCGIDDVRAGNLLTVTDAEIRYRSVNCVRQGADTTPLALSAFCDIGGVDLLPVTFEWRFTEGVPTRLLFQGSERPIFHCDEGAQ